MTKLELHVSKLKAPNALGKFVPFMPQSEHGERIIHYIYGKSGAGKSTLAKELCEYYDKLINVFLISPVQDDSFKAHHLNISDLVVLDKSNSYAKQKREYENAKIKLKYKKKEAVIDDDALMQLEIAINDLKPTKTKHNTYKFTPLYQKLITKPSLFVYDDNEAESEQDKLNFMQSSQLLTGRHDDISMLILNHQANSGNRTRNVINESNMFTCFAPFNRYTQYFAKEYLQLTVNNITKLKQLLKQSRSVTYYKNEHIILADREMYSLE